MWVNIKWAFILRAVNVLFAWNKAYIMELVTGAFQSVDSFVEWQFVEANLAKILFEAIEIVSNFQKLACNRFFLFILRHLSKREMKFGFQLPTLLQLNLNNGQDLHCIRFNTNHGLY